MIRNAGEKEISKLSKSEDFLKVAKKFFDQANKLKHGNEKKIYFQLAVSACFRAIQLAITD